MRALGARGGLKKFDMNQNEAVDYVMRMNPAERDVLAAGRWVPDQKTQKNEKKNKQKEAGDFQTLHRDAPHRDTQPRNSGPSGSRGGENGKGPYAGRGGDKAMGGGYAPPANFGGRGVGKPTYTKGAGRGPPAPAAAPITSSPSSAPIASVQAPPQIAAGPPPTSADTWASAIWHR